MASSSSSDSDENVSSTPPPPRCDVYNLKEMKDGTTCRILWSHLRDTLHPAQEAVGYASVQRKIHKDFTSRKKAQKRMDDSQGWLPFVLGPNNLPYLVDSHHTVSALEESGYGNKVEVTLKKVCDWSDNMADMEEFYTTMKQYNFMLGIGRPSTSGGDNNKNELPIPVDVGQAIPATIPQLKDDPWRSLAALVRKVKNEDDCPAEHDKCLRGYLRDCRPDDTMTPFFEFRWAYYFNLAYNRGCSSSSGNNGSLWDDETDCYKFQSAYEKLLEKDNSNSSKKKDRKEWQEAAKLLVPLCRGTKAQNFVLPTTLGHPMGGEPLPGYVSGIYTQILKDDPTCSAPTCPKLPKPRPIVPSSSSPSNSTNSSNSSSSNAMVSPSTSTTETEPSSSSSSSSFYSSSSTVAITTVIVIMITLGVAVVTSRTRRKQLFHMLFAQRKATNTSSTKTIAYQMVPTTTSSSPTTRPTATDDDDDHHHQDHRDGQRQQRHHLQVVDHQHHHEEEEEDGRHSPADEMELTQIH